MAFCTACWVGRLCWLLLLLLLAGSARCGPEPESESEPEPEATPNPAVEHLGDTNWTLILSGEWMLQFHAPWCPACKQIQADWEYLGKSHEELRIRVGKIDVTQEPGLSGRFFVTTLPTIYHAKEGIFRKYHGARTLEDFQSFIKEKKWEAVESISGWKSPSSIVMSGMAGLFRLSVWIRQMHSYLTETLGIPAWGSYIIFAVTTLVAGLLLGLILVLIADCICPPKRQKYQITEVVEGEEEDSEELEKREQDAPDWESHWSGAEDEQNDLSAKASGEESAFEDDQQPSDSETDGGLRKRLINEDC
ncbi:thioredoxin-related transmembrane protein 4 [Carcharodon carcharias]|uniref:thioredoxin-related transmembrane protein 4 n=1 Tax=Carcharodon carcharias TaxID=13397 RepID=UPI001B7F343D|nr:thioredoxin-related transmembrane protein 4 [Carcharodon carcharias]